MGSTNTITLGGSTATINGGSAASSTLSLAGATSGPNAHVFINGSGQGRVGIGVSSNPLGTLDVRAASATLPVASLSGQTTNAALLVDQSGTGDIFAASSSGQTRFTIAGNGNIITNGITGQTLINANCINTTNGIITSSGSCSSSTNYWQSVSAGTISTYNNTVDVLLGGTSTASAKFAFVNIAGSNTPTATIAGSIANNATFLTGDGTLGTTNSQALRLGSAGTGDIVLSGS